MNQTLIRRFAVPAAVAAAMLSLAACQRGEEPRTVGQQVDGAVATTEQKAAEVGADVKDAASDMKQAATEAGDAVGNKVKDAAITTAVNAELARDPKLSALGIDVDTQGGRVALSGTAPDAESRERATQLAQAVDGVTTVDNRLVVRGS